MASALCPAQFFWACDTTDLFTEIILAIIIVTFSVVLGLFLYLRGDWGGIFYHADKSDIAEIFEPEGSISANHVEAFGTLKVLKYGKAKGTVIIPRPGSSYKTARSPNIRLVLGRGLGVAVNPFLAPYIERMGGAWPEWSGVAPPAKPKDARQFYIMYCKWKADHETKPDKNAYILKRMESIEVPQIFTDSNDRDAWIAQQKEEIGAEYDEGAWGPFTGMLKKLSVPSDKWTKEQFGVMERLNVAIQSEPSELWPTWIAGQQIDAREMARWMEPVAASEMESAMNKIERALKTEQSQALFKIAMFVLLFFGIAVSFAIVYSVIVK